jgi:hypothetical protein
LGDFHRYSRDFQECFCLDFAPSEALKKTLTNLATVEDFGEQLLISRLRLLRPAAPRIIWQLGGIALYSAPNAGVISRDTSFHEQFLDVPIRKREPQIPTNRANNDVGNAGGKRSCGFYLSTISAENKGYLTAEDAMHLFLGYVDRAPFHGIAPHTDGTAKENRDLSR